jgi:anti-sigma factor RsiW
MMSNEPANADSSLEEQLVAYLDGELDATASERIEALLSTDAGVRQTLQQLNRSWDLLDELDRPDLDQRFTQSTLEMVTLAASEDVQQVQASLPRQRRRRWAIAVGGLAAAGLVGFLAVALLMPDRNRELVRDLPVLEGLDQYRNVDSIEFLRMLRREGLFAQEADDAP